MIELSWEHLPVRCIWLYLLVILRTHSRVNPDYILYICVNVKELFAQNTRNIWSLSDWNGTRNYNHLVPKQLSSIWSNWPNDWAELWGLICTVHLTLCCSHITYAFQSESALYICLNVMELLAPNRRDIWSLSDCKGTQNHNHLVPKQTFNHLTKLTKWFSWVESTCLCGGFDYIFLSFHIRIAEWIHTINYIFPWMSRNSLLLTRAISQL